MKIVVISAVSALCIGLAHGQGGTPIPMENGGYAMPSKGGQPAAPVTAEEYRLKNVKWYLSQPSPLRTGSTQLRRMGDEAAVDILKILAGRVASSPKEEQDALAAIGKSFGQAAATESLDVSTMLKGQLPLNATEQAAALDIVHASFEQPAAILNRSYKKPSATLLLLRYVGTKTANQKFAERAANESVFVQSSVAK